jgi:FkbM family methyltransferase
MDRLNEQNNNIAARLDAIAEDVRDIRMNQSFSAAYAMYEELKRKDDSSREFNKEKFDALLLLTRCFSESTKRYENLTAGRGLFLNQWRREDSEGAYLDIKGVRLTENIPNDLIKGIPVFSLIFQRSLFVHAFCDDNHDKAVVETLDRWMGEGARGYRDGDFDVTVKPGDIVIDAGAWIGDFSAYAAYKGATVYAFEPTPTTYALLCDTARLNDGKIVPVNKALSNVEGTVRFHAHTNWAGNRIAHADETVHTCMETLNATSLDSFVEENAIPRVDFIKADIQGGERDMLRGAVNVLRKFAPRLAIATDHLPDDPIVLEKIILKANPNYKIVQLRTVLFAAVDEKSKIYK